MIDGKSSDAKDPILRPKMISYVRLAHQHRTEAVMKLFESEIFGIAQSFLLASCNGTVAQRLTLREGLQLLQHRLPLQNLIL